VHSQMKLSLRSSTSTSNCSWHTRAPDRTGIVIGTAISGWCPLLLSRKHFQAAILERKPSTEDLLPHQLFVSRPEELRSFSALDASQWFPSSHLIAKSVFGFSSKMADGSDYVAFAKRSWNRFLEYADSRPDWFMQYQGLIVSELVESREASINGANGMVPKIHMSTGLSDDAAGRWPLDRTSCMRLPQRLRLDEVGGAVKPLTEILEQDDAQHDELERYRRPLTRLANTLFPLPRMFSLDVMLSPGGGLRFLEASTHPGTLAQPELQGSETPLNRYITFLLKPTSIRIGKPALCGAGAMRRGARSGAT
jgi:hypothetical protein